MNVPLALLLISAAGQDEPSALSPRAVLPRVVLADNIDPEDEGTYAGWMRDPANGFMSSSIVMKQGTEYSVWLGS